MPGPRRVAILHVPIVKTLEVRSAGIPVDATRLVVEEHTLRVVRVRGDMSRRVIRKGDTL